MDCSLPGKSPWDFPSIVVTFKFTFDLFNEEKAVVRLSDLELLKHEKVQNKEKT